MRLFICFIALFIFAGCPKEKTNIKKNPDKKNITINIKTGWENPNTYSVEAEGISEKDAIERAKHRILKDIVKVRVRKQSRYLDISKIQVEFSKPLQKGKVINKYTRDNKTIIIFQITDKGLRNKFERK